MRHFDRVRVFAGLIVLIATPVACQPTDQSQRPVTHDAAATAAAKADEQKRLARLAALENDAKQEMAAADKMANSGDPRTAVQKYAAALAAARQLDGPGLARDIRNRLLTTVGGLAVAPAIPDAARRRGIRGEALMQRAKNRNDYNRAVGEFQHAVDAAPWWSSAYYNLALAREGAGDAIGAIEAYKWFLAAEPRAREAPVIRERIVALEVDAEDQARRRKLVGYWRSQSGSLVRSELTQDGLVVTAVAPSASARKFGYAAGQIYFQGAADGNRFKGTAGRVPCGDGAHSTCKRCFGDMRQYRATAALRGDDKLVVTTDDVWITQWNIHTCAVLNKQRFNQDEVYTRDKAEERNRAGS